MVKLRFKRMGRKGRAYYRLMAIDSRVRRDGRPIEELGRYDPLGKDTGKQFEICRERVEYWLGVGAQPSDTVAAFLQKAGVKPQVSAAAPK